MCFYNCLLPVCVHTSSRAACVSFSSLWQRVMAVSRLHCSLSSHTAWPSNTAFQWRLRRSTCTKWLILSLMKVSAVCRLLLEWLRQRQQPESCHQPPTGTLTGHSQVTGDRTTNKQRHNPLHANALWSSRLVKLLLKNFLQDVGPLFNINMFRGRKKKQPSYCRKRFSVRNFIFCSKLLSPLKTSVRRAEGIKTRITVLPENWIKCQTGNSLLLKLPQLNLWQFFHLESPNSSVAQRRHGEGSPEST